jgi:integrase
LTPGQQEQAAMAFERLAPHNVTLNSVVADFITRRAANEKSVTFKTLFEMFVASKKKRSEAHSRGLKYTLPRFPRLHDRSVSEIQPDEIDAETEGMTPAVRNAFLRNLRAVFNFGIKRRKLDRNPIAALDFEQIKNGEVVTLTPTDAEALMAAAERENDLLPYHALALFAGIRPMELERLDWQHVDLTERHVIITAEVSKTGRRRIIDIETNLHAWLTHYIANGGSTEGGVTPLTNLRKRLRGIRAAAKINEWVQDVMRHSYASYWLAEHGDIDRLTVYLGHTNPTMLWKHYHKTSPRKEAAKYWQIKPSVRARRKIVAFASR